MKRISIIIGLLLAAASVAAGAEEPADTPVADLEHHTLDTRHEQRDRIEDELNWRDYETSDRGTTFRDFWKARQKVQTPAKLPERADPNLVRAAKRTRSRPTILNSTGR
jgi:hypothetical protein